jgi:Domain of unknown function (DUF5666)
MNRSIPVLIAIAGALVLAACGSTASAAKTSPSPAAGAAFRNGAAGQLVQINGQTLILTGPNGDITVTYTTTTTFTKTRIAALADITKGTCILATGQKNAAGVITATTVSISPKTAAGCAARPFGPGPAGASPRPSPSVLPSATPRPNGAFVAGEVTGVSGTSITVLTQTSGSQVIAVAAVATITDSAAVSASALQNGQCIRANGSRDSAGNVQAVSITITPAGPSGTCTTGLGRGRGGAGAFPGAGGGNGG